MGQIGAEWRPPAESSSTTEVTVTDKVLWVTGDFSEGDLERLMKLPRTFADLPYPEDDDL